MKAGGGGGEQEALVGRGGREDRHGVERLAGEHEVEARVAAGDYARTLLQLRSRLAKGRIAGAEEAGHLHARSHQVARDVGAEPLARVARSDEPDAHGGQRRAGRGATPSVRCRARSSGGSSSTKQRSWGT